MRMRIIFLLIFIILLVSGLYGYSLTKIEILSPDIKSSIVGEDIVIYGEVTAENKGVMPVNLDRIDYTVQLQANGLELASGFIEGAVLQPNQKTTLSFTIRPQINATMDLMLSLITSGSTIAVLDGQARFKELGFLEFSVPFTTSFDLEEEMREIIAARSKSALDKIRDALGI